MVTKPTYRTTRLHRASASSWGSLWVHVLARLVLRRLVGEDRYQRRFIRYIAPSSLIGLLYTIILLFASQGAHVVQQITYVLRVCAPLLLYFLVIFSSTIWIC